MIPYGMVEGYGEILKTLSIAALADLQALMSSLSGESPERTRQVLSEAFPELFNPYVAATSAAAATFYEEVRTASVGSTSGLATVQTLDRVETPRWNSLVGWGARTSVFEQGGSLLMYSLLAGGLSRTLTEIQSDTIIGNAELERVQVGFQRVPAPGCCAFCGMIASRGDISSTREGAVRVHGRGMPIVSGRKRRRGGQAGGIRARGSQRLGEKYHDHCKCTGAPVFEDDFVEMQPGAEKYYDAYVDASKDVEKKRAAEGYKGYGDQATSRKLILAEMRSTLGVK